MAYAMGMGHLPWQFRHDHGDKDMASKTKAAQAVQQLFNAKTVRGQSEQLAAAVVASAQEFAAGWLTEKRLNAEYALENDRRVENRRVAILKACELTAEGTEGAMVNLTAVQEVWVSEFQKCAWHRAGCKGPINLRLADTDKDGKPVLGEDGKQISVLPGLGAMTSTVRGIFLAANVARANVLCDKHVNQTTGPLSEQAYDAAKYLASSASWKDLYKHSTDIRMAAVRAGYVDAADGPKQRGGHTKALKAGSKAAQNALGVIHAVVKDASMARSLVREAEGAFAAIAPVTQRDVIHRLTEEYIEKVNAALEPELQKLERHSVASSASARQAVNPQPTVTTPAFTPDQLEVLRAMLLGTGGTTKEQRDDVTAPMTAAQAAPWSAIAPQQVPAVQAAEPKAKRAAKRKAA